MTRLGGEAGTDAHLLWAFEGTSVPSSVEARFATQPPAGVSLFRYANVVDAEQVRGLTDELQRARPADTPPLLIACDQEGGQFLGLGPGTTRFAGNLALAAVGDAELAERVGAAIGREALAVGANVVYAPVCDLLLEPDNPSVGIRSFGDDPEQAALLAAGLVRGLRSAGVAAAPKHFPGAGAGRVDSHHHLGGLDASAEVLRRRELVPFRAALDADPGMVMTAHVAVPALTGRDDLPATLASAVVDGLLRDELGFDGVVATDALDMAALAQGAGRIVDAVAALRAGVDLLLCAPGDDANEELRRGLQLAASRGLLDRDRLARSRARIDRLRRRLATPPNGLDVLRSREHLAVAQELARRCMTLVRDDAGLLPLRREHRVLVLQPRPRDVTPADTTVEVAPTLADAVRGYLPDVDAFVYPDPPDAAAVTEAVELARLADVVVLGTSAAHLVPEQRTLADAILAAGVPTVHVALRTPHDVTFVPAPTALCSYGILPPQTAALAAVLAGVADAPGRLPVTLPRGGSESAEGRER